MAEADAFPPSVQPSPTATEAAHAAVLAIVEKQRADADKKIADSEIADPGRPAPAVESRDARPAKPDLIDGASTVEKIPDSLLDRALAVDISVDEAKEMSAATLRKLVVKLEHRSERPAEPRAPAAEVEEEEFELPPISASEEYEYDPKYLEAMKARDQLLLDQKKELAELKKRDTERTQIDQQRQVKAEEKQFERWIAEHDEFHDDLGEGKGFPQNERHARACKSLWARTAAIVQADGLSIEDAMEEAAAGMFRDKVKAKAAKEMAGKLETRASQFTKRPAGSKQAEKAFGKERATDALAQALAARK